MLGTAPLPRQPDSASQHGGLLHEVPPLCLPYSTNKASRHCNLLFTSKGGRAQNFCQHSNAFLQSGDVFYGMKNHAFKILPGNLG